MNFKKILNNYVVVKCHELEIFNDKLQVTPEHAIFIDPSFDPNRNIRTMFTVVDFDRKIKDLKIGETIFTSHWEVELCLGKKMNENIKEFSVRYIKDWDTNEIYLFLSYKSIFLKQDLDGNMVAMNDRSICTLDLNLIGSEIISGTILKKDCIFATVVYSQNFEAGRRIIHSGGGLCVPVNFNDINNHYKELYYFEKHHIKGIFV